MEAIMTRQDWVYRVVVGLLGIISALPQVATLIGVGFIWYSVGVVWPFPRLPGMGTAYGISNRWSRPEYWQGKLVDVLFRQDERTSTNMKGRLSLRDPETGTQSDLTLDIPTRSVHQTFVFDDRLFLKGSNCLFEVVGETVEELPSAMIPRTTGKGRLFPFNGKLACMDNYQGGYRVFVFEQDQWKPAGQVALPDFSRPHSFNGLSEPIAFGPFALKTSLLEVLSAGDELHLFLRHDGRLMYRRGMKLFTEGDSSSKPPASMSDDKGPIETVAYRDDQSVTPEQAFDDWARWTLVRSAPASHIKIGDRMSVYPVLVEGQPAAVFVDGVMEGEAVAHLYRFDGTNWNECGSQDLPFGSMYFSKTTSADGQKSHLAVTTTAQISRLFAVEPDGLRPTQGLDRRDEFAWMSVESNAAILSILFNAAIPVMTFLIGIVLAGCVAALMWWSTKPAYQFGVSSVNLASLTKRGVARLIDLSVISLTTTGIGAILLRDFDWLAFAEALNLHIWHTTTRTAYSVSTVLGIWLCGLVIALLIAQSRWGITPGKWLCGLKTVRTTLRPIGFARSLAREFVFFVDCGNFLCWTPGILSIALTTHRQRLGDLVADTIVIESRSVACARQPDDDVPAANC